MSGYNFHLKRWNVFIAALSIGAIALTLGSSCNGSSILVPGGHTIIVSMTPADLFSPDEITVDPGDSVKFVNTDSDPHAPIADPLNAVAGGPNSDSQFPSGVQAGYSYVWQVPDSAVSGTEWYYHCRFHGTAGDGDNVGTGMVGEITVN